MSLTHDGEKEAFSVGIVAPGEYGFGAIAKEHYRVTSGEISFWEEDGKQWKVCREGEEFKVVEHKDFKIKADKVSSYICFY